jgi:manganese transport protein
VGAQDLNPIDCHCPAVLVISYFGESVTGKLLILSQVILSLQLGFAIIPLIHFVSDKSKMNGFEIDPITRIAAWTIASIIVTLNAKLVFDEINGWFDTSENPIVLWLTVVPLAVGFLILLLYIIFKPFIHKGKPSIDNHSPHHLRSNFQPGITTRNALPLP